MSASGYGETTIMLGSREFRIFPEYGPAFVEAHAVSQGSAVRRGVFLISLATYIGPWRPGYVVVEEPAADLLRAAVAYVVAL